MKKKINYISNLELTSLLIRIKNFRKGLVVDDAVTANRFINNRIALHTRVSDLRFINNPSQNEKKQRVLAKLNRQIIRLSEQCPSDKKTYNRFGSAIILIIKRILTKPQFSGYTYKDDFYSDAIYKILKYLSNFDHTLISKTTGTNVNAFAYITQIVHMSILFIINERKSEQNMIKRQIELNLNEKLLYANNLIVEKERQIEQEKIVKTSYIQSSDCEEAIGELYENVKKINLDKIKELNVSFKKSLDFTIDQFKRLKEIQNEFRIINYCGRY